MAGEPRPKRGILLAVALLALLAAVWFWIRRNELPAWRGAKTAVPSSANGSAEEARSLRSSSTEPEAPANTAFSPPTTTRRDKELREQARVRILQAMGTPDDKSGSAKPTLLEPPKPPPPALDKDYIQARIHEDFLPMAKDCYETALKRDGGLGGKMVFQFAIVGDESVGGIVESAELDPTSTLDEAELVTCMRESLLSVTFPPPPKGGRVTVTYPFELSPGDD